MTSSARAEAWVRLHAAGLAARSLVPLLQAFGSPEAILAARPAQLGRYLAPGAVRALATPDASRLEATLRWLAEPGHDLIAWDDPEYPPALLETGDPPPVLYTLGERSLLRRAALGIVGSRNATPQGRADAEAFAYALSAAGLTIVSGLALGIDAAAHVGGLRGPASTIAVVGTGPDRIYPARNRDLAHEIAARGLMVSEFAPGTPALKHNFPRRNRLISGLARGLLVVEATLSSGSLITARLAAEQGREVFAIPGSIHSPFSRGCHRLIREGAKLVETAGDVLEELGLASPVMRTTGAAAVRLDAESERILAALGTELLEVDTIVARSGLPASRVAAALTTLELEERVAASPGGRWQQVHRD